jgi:hypothetical protein
MRCERGHDLVIDEASRLWLHRPEEREAESDTLMAEPPAMIEGPTKAAQEDRQP